MSVLLALYPNTKGMGFACVKIPQRLIDAGVLKVRPLYNDRLLERTEKILDFYRPKIILVREPGLLRSERIKRLIDAIARLAIVKNLPVHYYTRYQIKEVFNQFNASSKYEISQKIVEWFPDLQDKEPKLRMSWEVESHHMGLFDAIALAVAHEYIKE